MSGRTLLPAVKTSGQKQVKMSPCEECVMCTHRQVPCWLKPYPGGYYPVACSECFRGEQGEQGIRGATGPRGATGARGATGTHGARGVAGPHGATGPRGATGPAGKDGAGGMLGVTSVFPGVKYMGCFKDDDARVLPNLSESQVSFGDCLGLVRKKMDEGYGIMGLQWAHSDGTTAQCFGGPIEAGGTVGGKDYSALGPATNCVANEHAHGNINQMGSNWSNAIYLVGPEGTVNCHNGSHCPSGYECSGPNGGRCVMECPLDSDARDEKSGNGTICCGKSGGC